MAERTGDTERFDMVDLIGAECRIVGARREPGADRATLRA